MKIQKRPDLLLEIDKFIFPPLLLESILFIVFVNSLWSFLLNLSILCE